MSIKFKSCEPEQRTRVHKQHQQEKRKRTNRGGAVKRGEGSEKRLLNYAYAAVGAMEGGAAESGTSVASDSHPNIGADPLEKKAYVSRCNELFVFRFDIIINLTLGKQETSKLFSFV